VLIDRMKHHPLPPYAGEIDCANWAQFLLKFVISHPAVTCAIPATRRVDHMEENMGAMRGRLPDAKMRTRMARYAANV
jgi:aryl-alcohol dehydrogenase-like predicted oxidoreductase